MKWRQQTDAQIAGIGFALALEKGTDRAGFFRARSGAMPDKQHNPAQGDDARNVPWWFSLILISLIVWWLAYFAVQFV